MGEIIPVLIFLSVFFGLAIFLKVPVAFSMGIGALLFIYIHDLNFGMVASIGFSALNQFTYLAIPFFIFSAVLIEFTGLGKSLLNLAGVFLWGLRGGLGYVAVAGSMLFGAVSGSALATVSAIGGVMIPEMKKNGYSKGAAAAICGACSFLGTLIPPSIPDIVYAISASVSIADVWIATTPPGILLGAFYMVINYFFYGRKLPLPPQSGRIGVLGYLKNLGIATRQAFGVLLIPVIIFGGIYGGVFTPTEAGAVAAVYAIIYFFIRRMFRTVNFLNIVREAAVMSASIGLLIVFATLVGRVIAMSGSSRVLVTMVTATIDSPYAFIFTCIAIFIIIGTFMDINTAILILTPLLLPTAKAMGMDPIHFGVIMIFTLSLGFITPPFAVSIFISCRIAGVSFDKSLVHLIPFFIAGLVVLLVVVVFPDFVLFAPKLFK